MNELSTTSLGFQPQNLVGPFLSLWLILSVISVVIYRLFRGKPEDVTNEVVMLKPKKKKR